MADSRNKPELKTLDYRAPTTEKMGKESYKSHHFEQPANTSPAPMGFNSVVVKPETKVNKTEIAEEQPQIRTGNCPNCGEDWKTHDYS